MKSNFKPGERVQWVNLKIAIPSLYMDILREQSRVWGAEPEKYARSVLCEALKKEIELDDFFRNLKKARSHV